MEEILFKMMDDQAILRTMKENYTSPGILHLIDQLILDIDVEIEGFFDE
jgi:hypothetical protein